MRYLVLSDIHANFEALRAVLRRVRRQRFDRIAVLGDLVGYGAAPNETMDLIRKMRRLVIVRGNHDKVCCGLESGEGFNRIALASAQWTETHLSPSHRRWLAALPQGPRVVDSRFSISHGTPLDEDAYIFGEIEALNTFQYFETPICFFGHSHFPVVFGLSDEAMTTRVPNGRGHFRVRLEPGTRYLINPGSVGQPRDGDNRASFGIYDSDTRTITIHRVRYQFEKTQRRIHLAGLPAALAERLAVGR